MARVPAAQLAPEPSSRVRRCGREITMHEFPDWLASTLASDASVGRGVLPPGISSLKPDARAVGPAVVGGSVSLGGTIIRDGDLVIADEDGVVIWPKEQIDALLGKADAKRQQDNARLVRLQQAMRQGAGISTDDK